MLDGGITVNYCVCCVFSTKYRFLFYENVNHTKSEQSGAILQNLARLGLSTSCSRFPKKLPVISQKVAQKLLKKVKSCFLYMFVTKVSQQLLKNNFLLLLSSFIWSDANICKLYNKREISKQKIINLVKIVWYEPIKLLLLLSRLLT